MIEESKHNKIFTFYLEFGNILAPHLNLVKK